MGYFGWKPYVPVAARRKKASRLAAVANTSGAALSPVPASRGAIAMTFWGKSWCDNLERYSDFSNRLPRGRTYVRSGAVIDLQITQGEVHAQVVGSSLYHVTMRIAPVPKGQWQALCGQCAGSIHSLVEVLQGRLSGPVMEHMCKPGTGLFPAPAELSFDCSCPDWASMCKHVAAVLYGVGARLDHQPQLLFTLRHVDAKDLISEAGTGLSKPAKPSKTGKVLRDISLADVFGIDMVEDTAASQATRPKKVVARKTPTKVAARKTLPSKPAAVKRSVVKPAKEKPATLKLATAKTPTTTKTASKKKPLAGRSSTGKTTLKAVAGHQTRASRATKHS